VTDGADTDRHFAHVALTDMRRPQWSTSFG
jgi:hypothetical protein